MYLIGKKVNGQTRFKKKAAEIPQTCTTYVYHLPYKSAILGGNKLPFQQKKGG